MNSEVFKTRKQYLSEKQNFPIFSLFLNFLKVLILLPNADVNDFGGNLMECATLNKLTEIMKLWQKLPKS